MLSLLNKGGLYIIDDMLPQPDWPDGHQEKATRLINHLEPGNDLLLAKQVWASGIIIAVKIDKAIPDPENVLQDVA